MEIQQNSEAGGSCSVVGSLLGRMMSDVERRVGNAKRFVMAKKRLHGPKSNFINIPAADHIMGKEKRWRNSLRWDVT